MKVPNIIGADLSKEFIDFVCHESQSHLRISNNKTGFKQFFRWLAGRNIDNCMIVMEHTGFYSYHFEKYLHKNHLAFAKVAALQIKRSLGIIRGKSDKIDARRIAEYGNEKFRKLKPVSKPDPLIERLQMLRSTRELLVKQRASVKAAIQEYQNLLPKSDLVLRSYQKMIKSYAENISNIEAEMDRLISCNEEMLKNYQLLRSIKSVGPVLARAVIIKTKNFKDPRGAKHFSCLCGSAPFPDESGNQGYKKSRVSHLADKRMKTLLELAARNAIQHNTEIKTYYERRTNAGKSKQSTLNVVRNKLIMRMFSVIKRQTPYTEFLKVA